MVERGPAARLETLLLQRDEGLLVDARLGVDHVVLAVEAWTIDRRLRLEAFAEDGRRDTDDRRPEPTGSGRADPERDPVRVERDARSHHAAHPVARPEIAPEEV